MPQHSGCWYCGTTQQKILQSLQRKIIDRDGKASQYAVAICDECAKSDTLDQRVPPEARTGGSQ